MLELKSIFAGYGRKSVLNGVSAAFEKGKLTGIVGVNGCGKSTLLKAITGILPLNGGEIAIDGEDLHLMSRNGIAKKAAYLPQCRNTPDMTVEQLVLHGRFPYLSYPRRYKESDREIARKAMDSVGITHLGDQLLQNLSGGMRQNAYIAMALAQDTDYILLDEPTTYLDIAHRLELMKLLKKLAERGKGIVTVMHDLPLAFDFSDEIVVINGGSIAIQDSPKAISGSPLIADIFGVKIKYLQDENKYFYTALSPQSEEFM
ncbi:MAG: ABC transporter ATP-binding protein [Ruminococcaceae bacterium]|nr:ABC transporter ATP-binding protein [Oscillospiraceae bacterium]